MAIMTPKPITNLPTQPQTKPIAVEQKVKSKTYLDSFVDTRYTPSTDLLTNISGAPWVVTYFSQVIDENSVIQGQSLQKMGPYQQYKRINHLEIRVTTTLSVSQDTTTKEMTQNGTAMLFPYLIPNEGDMFVADTGDGNFGIFQVTNSNKKSLFNDSVYEIDYILISIGSQERIDDLITKSVETYTYVKTFLQAGKCPLITQDEFNLTANLKKDFKFLANWYVDHYYNSTQGTIIVPEQDMVSYDPILVYFLKAIISTDDCFNIIKINALNHNDLHATYDSCLLTGLLKKDIRYIKTGWKRAGFSSYTQFNKSAFLFGGYFSNVNYFLNPLDIDFDDKEGPVYLYKQNSLPITRRTTKITHKTISDKIDNYLETPYIYLVTIDDYYILSEAFYNKLEGKMSCLESMLMNYLNDEALDLNLLRQLSDDAMNWSSLEKFYYIPLLLLLLKYTLKGS